MDHGTLSPLFPVKHRHGLRNPSNTVTYVVTTNRADLAQKIKPIFYLYYSKLQFTNDIPAQYLVNVALCKGRSSTRYKVVVIV